MKYFVLGLGAQKAGTSWLHSYLSGYGSVSMGFVKELHVWDAKYVLGCEKFRVRTSQLFSLRKQDWLRFAMQNIEGFYEWYFKPKFAQKINITGDITPSYCGLDVSQLMQIKQRILKMGAAPRVVFIMRDPFERCWSAIRFQKRRGLIQQDLSDERLLLTHFKDHEFQFRTRYEVACRNIDRAFSDNEVFYCFYEALFTNQTMTDLSSFLGLEPDFDRVMEKVNASPKSTVISDIAVRQVKEFYAETYKYCWERFPISRQLWAD